MATLYITRGLPGSGKTTRALAWVSEDPARRVRVNRDDTRAMLHGQRLGTREQEDEVSAVTHAAILGRLHAGKDVVVDDTNLPAHTVRTLQQLATQAGAGFEVWDLTHVTLATCIERDRLRGLRGERSVGESAINQMFIRHLAGRPSPLPLPDETDPAPAAPPRPYVPDPDLPRAIMVDIDGTAAIRCDRSPYDETRVGEDTPNEAVRAVVSAMWNRGYRIIFCSGRTEACREATEQWLAEHILNPDWCELYMRKVGDTRKDSVVKLELFDRHIRNRYNIKFVLDDRDQVVRMWRSIGLTVFQVADGAF